MDLKLKNNLLLSLGNNIDSCITNNCTTVYVKDCPNVSGINILRQCPNLTRVRLDLGNVSGSLTELATYSSLAGFNDNYEPQTKPRLVGSWTINDWYTAAQLTQLQSIFDGLTIIEDTNYLLDFNNFAIQTLDDTQPNYNPAVAIKLNASSIGTTLSEPIISGKGKWFITKTQAAAVTSIPSFEGINNIIDSSGIVTPDTTIAYSFEKFNELIHFTSVTSLGRSAFRNCQSLKEIDFSNVTTFDYYVLYNTANLEKLVMRDSITVQHPQTFVNPVVNLYVKGTLELFVQNAYYPFGNNIYLNDTLLQGAVTIPSSVTTIHPSLFYSEKNVTSVDLVNVTAISDSAFYESNVETIVSNNITTIGTDAFQKSKLRVIDLPATVTSINNNSFRSCSNLTTFICRATIPPTLGVNVFYSTNNVTIYVPDANVNDYKAANNWSTYSSFIKGISEIQQ